MDREAFRRLALDLPGVAEKAHFGNPDFRVKDRIFATLGVGGRAPMVKLTPEEQALLIEAEPALFSPCAGAWGRSGSTYVDIERADDATVRDALARAHRNVSSPKRRR